MLRSLCFLCFDERCRQRLRRLACLLFFLLPTALKAQPQAAPDFEDKLKYTFASERSWIAFDLLPGVALEQGRIFWRGGLGSFVFQERVHESYRLGLGFSSPILAIMAGLERNSINALLDYAPQQSLYHGASTQLRLNTPSQELSFSARLTLAEMSSNTFSPRLVLANQFAITVKLRSESSWQMQLENSFDLLVDLDDNGNKIAMAMALPLSFEPLPEQLLLRLTPQLGYVQRTTRQAEYGIFDDFLYRPPAPTLATSRAIIDADLRFYPLAATAADLLKLLFAALDLRAGFYHLDPLPLQQVFTAARFGGAVGWGEESNAVGLRLEYNAHQQWRLSFLLNRRW